MPKAYSTSPLRQQIARRFAELRDRAGLSLDQEAEQLPDVSRATLTRIEAGDERVILRPTLVEAWLKVLPATPEEAELLLAMVKETRVANDRGWWHSYVQTELPRGFSLFVAMEDAANAIHQYEAELMPGLLQTREYAERNYRASGRNESDAQRLGDIRMARQSVLTRDDAPEFEVVLNEAVFRRSVGGVDVMVGQLSRLLESAARDNVSIRILTFSAGAYPAMGTSYTVMDFVARDGNEAEPTLVYVDTYTGSMCLRAPEEVAIYKAVWDGVTAMALDVDASREFIVRELEGLRRG